MAVPDTSLPQAQPQVALELVEVVRLHHVAQRHQRGLAVGHFDAHVALARHGRLDAHRVRRERQGQVVGQGRQLPAVARWPAHRQRALVAQRLFILVACDEDIADLRRFRGGGFEVGVGFGCLGGLRPLLIPLRGVGFLQHSVAACLVAWKETGEEGREHTPGAQRDVQRGDPAAKGGHAVPHAAGMARGDEGEARGTDGNPREHAENTTGEQPAEVATGADVGKGDVPDIPGWLEQRCQPEGKQQEQVSPGPDPDEVAVKFRFPEGDACVHGDGSSDGDQAESQRLQYGFKGAG